MTVMVALRLGRSPSKLLMPLAFSSYAGSLLVLTGSPVNVLVSTEAERVGVGAFDFFAFALVGVPLVLGTLAIVVLLGPRLLPDRRPRSIAADLGDHPRSLVAQYAPDSDLLARHEVPDGLFSRESGVAEVVVPPRSPLIGTELFPGMLTPSGDLVVLALQRAGQDVGPAGRVVAAGDTLLLEGSWSSLDEHLEDDREVLVVDEPASVRRQVVPMGPGARRTIVIMGAMVAGLASGAVPAAVAGVLAVIALVLTRVMDVDRVYRAIDWTTVVLVAGLIPVSTAIQDTGAGQDMADLLVDTIGDAGPRALLAGLFVVAALFSVAASDTATALILIPVAVEAAAEFDVSARPVLMSVAIA